MSLEILKLPDPRLREVCAPVGTPDADTRALAAAMLEAMYAAPGRGLAGSQVGAMQRIFVMDAGWKEGAPEPRVFVDPEIVAQSGTRARATEGCLSIPGETVEVERPDGVTLRWTDLDGARQEESFDGFRALCVQHEIDHLDGRLCIDLIPEEERHRIEARFAADAA